MGLKWEVGSNTVIELKGSFTGKTGILVNGKEVGKHSLWSSSRTSEFELPDGSKAKLTYSGHFAPEYKLYINEALVLPTNTTFQMLCANCKTECKVNDTFCAGCGSQLPTTEIIDRHMQVKRARVTIQVLSGMFLAFGIVMFFMQKGTYDNALLELAKYTAEEKFPNLVNGKSYLVGELRAQIQVEKFGILGLNIFLALIMLGLSFWAKKSPLGALLVATAVYVAIQVLNGVVDPTTISQGIFVKIIVITYLIKGIRSTLELKPAHVRSN